MSNAVVDLEAEKKRLLLQKVRKTQLLAAQGQVPAETAAKATLIAAAVMASSSSKSKPHWPLVVTEGKT